ncbi:MAG: metallophosphoesterase [Treponema sp.]|nr:metallophosphoesterase [Treponema sp.]
MADYRLFQQVLEQYATTSLLPVRDALISRIDGAVAALECERGGVRDLTSLTALPLVVVPDLHGRRDFLYSLLFWHLPASFRNAQKYSIPDEPLLSLLIEGLVAIVCVGDIFHSEGRGKERWLCAYSDYLKGNVTSYPMQEEMCENLGLLQMILLLQMPFSDIFVCLKGNHENILNKNGGGDYAFRKFAEEGEQVRAFMLETYGEEVLQKIWQWEQLLPLCAISKNCVISHGEPARAYTMDEIVSMESDVVAGLTWTRNGEAEEGSVVQTMESLLGAERARDAVWIAGHRPVEGRYALRQNGRLVQIHNPWKQQVALVSADHSFNPKTDILEV